MSIVALVHAAAAAAPSPSPSPTGIDVPPADITSPGLIGFLVMFGLALVCVVLFLSLTKQLRRVSHRAARLDDDAGDDATAGPVADATAGPTTTATGRPTDPEAGTDPDDERH